MVYFVTAPVVAPNAHLELESQKKTLHTSSTHLYSERIKVCPSVRPVWSVPIEFLRKFISLLLSTLIQYIVA